MSFKPIDSNRDEYRKYLERSGVIEALSKVLINLFHEQERPENAVDYLRINIGDARKDRDTIESLKQELTDARREIEELKKLATTSNTVTAQTNTDGGGDAPILQSAANVNAAENLDTAVNLDTATAGVATSPTTLQSENIENVVEKNIVIDNPTVVIDKEEIMKVDNEEAEKSAPVSTVVPKNDEEPSKDPQKNAE